MPDRVLAGDNPPFHTAGTPVPGYPPGAVWLQLLERAADPTGKTIGVVLRCTNMATYVAVSLSGPEQDGGPWIVSQRPTTWSTAPAGGDVGVVAVNDIVLAHPNFYRFEALCSGVRVHYDVQVGVPGVDQMGRDIDLELAQEATYLGRLAKERQKMRDVMRPTGILGAPKSSRVKMPRRVP